MKFILGKKLGMSQIFSENGKVVPVTVILAKPMNISQIKNQEKDGYSAVQVTAGKSKKEYRGQTEEIKLGDLVDVSVFGVGDLVKVSGISKGKGFQGAVKRHGFRGMPASHGHKHVKRHVGSIGQRFPQHTLKGLRMAGRMGADRVSVRGLSVVSIDKENNLLAVKGAVPGRKGVLLEVRGN
ncbi:MAG: 50S ribosomal protein L3 [Candidatus Yanofskybacteria bacterium]|nr:50S ribosomal protein L3 [Candidatus Yanofskybacteria bacterium]